MSKIPWYHVAPISRRQSILDEGLKANQSDGFTVAGQWADQLYGGRPVFLSRQPWQSGPDFDLWLVDSSGLALLGDYPSLIDCGAMIEEDVFWFEDQSPDSLADQDDYRFLDVEPWRLIEATESAATMDPIEPWCLSLVSE